MNVLSLFVKIPILDKNLLLQKSATFILVHRDAVWGKLSCTVGVTGCVCVNCGFCLHLSYWPQQRSDAPVRGTAMLLVCVHRSGVQKKEALRALTHNGGEIDSRVFARNPFIRGLPPAWANLSLNMHIPSKPPTVATRSGYQRRHDVIKDGIEQTERVS